MIPRGKYDLLIEGGDYLLLHASKYGHFKPEDLIADFKFDISTYYLIENDKVLIANDYARQIINFCKENGYLQKPNNPTISNYECLTDLARDIKERGGWNNYKENKTAKEKAIFDTVEWAKQSAINSGESLKHSKITMYSVIAYSIITAVGIIVSMQTCCYNKPNDLATKKANTIDSVIVTPIKMATDTVKK